MNHAIQGQPRQMGQDREFWQNMVHWTREWKTTLIFVPWESHVQYKKSDMTLNDELSRSGGAQYATGEEQRKSPRRNDEVQTKQKQHLVVDESDDDSKV